jgi:hypothetical protein
MRAVSSSFLAMLVVVALFWGNCFSCPQLLVFLVTSGSAHSCCHREGGHSQVECQSLGLKHFQKADAGTQSPTPPVTVALVHHVDVPVPVSHVPVVLPQLLHSPPDLEILHSTFRI